MMIFVEYVDVDEASTRCQRSQQTPYGFRKKIVNQAYSQILLNSIDCFIIISEIVGTNKTRDKNQTVQYLENREDHSIRRTHLFD